MTQYELMLKAVALKLANASKPRMRAIKRSFTGAQLRAMRARNGVGRPPANKVLMLTELSDVPAQAWGAAA